MKETIGRKQQTGKVILAGAGPGDPALLTLKAKRAIEEADVVVYDRLVSKEILALIPADRERVDVGKNAGHHPVPQDEINRILIEKAKRGKKVLRLKGGDPYIFGRGGEEMEALYAAGLPFEEIPGITSAIAAPAYAGIPLTHRDYCSSVHIITGHAKAGSEMKIDYEALLRLNGTLVFLMSLSNLGEILQGLLSAGMEPTMPAAVIENGTRANMRKVVSVLADLEEKVQAAGLHAPALTVVGKVCALSDNFDWFDRLPLHGKRILVTQPVRKPSRLAEGLRRLGAEVLTLPSVDTVPLRPLAVPYAEYGVLAFTSGEGVRSFCSWLMETGRDMRVLAGKRIAVIGPSTERELEHFALRADFMPHVYSGKAMAEEMSASGFLKPGEKVLLLRTDKGSEDITQALAAAGVPYLDCPVYSTKSADCAEMELQEGIDLVTFTSKSAVDGLTRLLTPQGRETLLQDGKSLPPALCIGEKTADAARAAGFDVLLSKEASIPSMLEEAVRFASRT